MVDKVMLAAIQPSILPKTGGVEEGGVGRTFGQLLGDLASQGVDVGNRNEQEGMKAMARQADIVDVVNAVSNAEVTLGAVVAVRDRVITAYQEIIKMPI